MNTSSVRDQGFAERSLPRSNGTPSSTRPGRPGPRPRRPLGRGALAANWDAFRHHLITAIDEDDRRPYWDSWVTALDAFVAECGLVA